MTYEPSRKTSPQQGPGMEGNAWLEDDQEAGGSRAIPLLTHDLSELDETSAENTLERWSNQLADTNGRLQAEHSELEEQIALLTHRKIVCEARIEMVHVTAQQIGEQLEMFRKSEARAAKIKEARRDY